MVPIQSIGHLLVLPLLMAVAHARTLGRPPVMGKVLPPHVGPVIDRTGAELPPLDTVYYFDQLIDHDNPSLGTFQQRYWHTWEFYEAGGPIIIMTPGEQDADGFEGFLTNSTINGQIAQQQNGATIVIEHRYYGYSNPYDDLSVASLQYHTIQQAINDLVYFAYNVDLPMPGGDSVSPDDAPWILIGGSYAGALTSFTMVNQPGVFYAGWASSAVVESIVDYWGYFDIIRTNMPPNCSADVEAVIAHIDDVFTSENEDEINAIKQTFNMNLSHLDDFAAALQYPVFTWQDLQPSSELTNLQFFEFCDALEVKDGVNAPAAGWGLDYALEAWGSWWQSSYYPSICSTDETADECLGTYNASSPVYTDIAVNNADRSWTWIKCNEMGFFQDGAPTGTPTIVSRLIQPTYWERQCTSFFPEAFSSPTAPQVNVTNKDYDGWLVNVDNLFFVNGKSDPWRDATVSSDGTNFSSTASQPIVVDDGFHCSDMYTVNAGVDPTIASVQALGLSTMQGWLEDW